MDSEWICPICLEEESESQPCYQLQPCGHRFHTGCVIECLRRNGSSCPICRDDPYRQQNNVREPVTQPSGNQNNIFNTFSSMTEIDYENTQSDEDNYEIIDNNNNFLEFNENIQNFLSALNSNNISDLMIHMNNLNNDDRENLDESLTNFIVNYEIVNTTNNFSDENNNLTENFLTAFRSNNIPDLVLQLNNLNNDLRGNLVEELNNYFNNRRNYAG